MGVPWSSIFYEFERISGAPGVLFFEFERISDHLVFCSWQNLKEFYVPWCFIFEQLEKILGVPSVSFLIEFERMLGFIGVLFLDSSKESRRRLVFRSL